MSNPIEIRKIRIETPKWAEPITYKPARYRCAHGGRGSGKSHYFAESLVDRCLDRLTSAVCIREIQRTLTHSVKRLIESKIRKFEVTDAFRILENRIITPGGGLIIFEGMQNHNADSIKSLEDFDIAWIEEAQNLSQRSLDLLRPTIRRPNSEIWASWNPRYEHDPIDVLFRNDDPPTNSIIVETNYEDNPWFPDILETERLYDKRTNYEKYLHVWKGQYIQRTDAKVFNNWKIDEFEAPADAIHRFGADWGFSVDPTVLIRSHIIGRKMFIDFEAYKIGCEILDLADLFFTVPESEKWPIIADSSRPETISHLQNHGFPKLYKTIGGPGSVEEGIEWLKTFEIIIHPRCKHTIDEISLYSYKIDQDTDKVLPVLQDSHNHVIDSLRYAHEGLRRAEKEKKRQQHDDGAASPRPMYNPIAQR